MKPIYVDTHCHLNHADFDPDREAVLLRAREQGVTTCILIGYDLPSSRRAVELANPAEGLYATVGVHPHDAEHWNPDTAAEIRTLAGQPGVVAIGEIGLDFYRDLSPREAQYAAFRAQLDLALDLNLPIVVHTRESVSASLDVLESFARAGGRGVMHCWSGTVDEALRAVDSGMHLGIGGVLTYKKPGPVAETVPAVPMERLVLETDAPYLPPTPYRGKRNEPAYIPLIAAKLAELRGEPVEEIAEQTTRNARQLFRLA